MFLRQRAIVRLIENEGGSIARLRLVKLAFLLSLEADAPRTGLYDFVPYKHGPFSFTLYHDLRNLVRDGWLTDQQHDVGLTQDAHVATASLDKEFLSLIDTVSSRHRFITTKAVVDGVYREHPWFTLNSDMLQRRAARRPAAQPAVYTVGYEGIMVDALLDGLLRKGIRRLIDVRSNPIARRYGFHKSTLNRLCGDVGIEYLHFASLGVPSAWRRALQDRASYEGLFQRYEREILPNQSPTVEKVARLMAAMPSALICMEAAHDCCHRSRLAAEVSRRTSLPVIALREQ